MFSSVEYLPSDMSHPLEMLQRIEKQLVSFRVSREEANLIDILQRIGEEYSSICMTADKNLSLLYYFLDTLQQAEEKCGSVHMFSDSDHLLETLKQLDEQHDLFCMFLGSVQYWSSEGPDIQSTLKQIAEKIPSFLGLLDGYHIPEKSRPLDIVLRIEEDWGSLSVFSDEYLSKLSHLRQTLQQTEDECISFPMFLNKYKILEEPNFLHSLQHIVEEWGSLRMQSDKFRSKISNFLETSRRIEEECYSFLIFFEKYLFSEESHPLETLQWIEEEWGSSSLLSEKYLSSLDGFKFLKRDFKFLDIILNFHIIEYETDAINKVKRLFRRGLVEIYGEKARPWSHHFHDYVSYLQRNFWKTKTEIRRATPSFLEGSFRLLTKKDGIVFLNFVMEYIETVADNLSDLLKFNDPNLPLMGQIEKALKELKFLNGFVCFVSDRCIEPHVLHTFISHVLEVAWHTTMVTWLYLPSYECGDEEYRLFSDLIETKIQPIESSIREIYIDVLQALKLVQSQWYPIIQIKHVVDCEVGFVETLLHNLEELPISNNYKATKAILQEMCNFLRVNLINLPIQVTELHLRDIDSVIVDAGLLVYSLTDSEKDNHDFPGKIQTMQAVIYIIVRKIFLLQFNLPGIDGVGSAKFILDNREMFLSLYSNSVDSVKSQLRTIQKELKCFQAVVERQDGLQHFVTQTNGLVYEVEYIFDSCKKNDVPDWCLFLWILNVGEDIRALMAEVAELQEKNVVDVVFHNTTNASNADISSQFARNSGMNEEMVGRNDVMDDLRRKLTEGSNLDVISIAGMPGVGKTTLANKLYSDQSIVSHFDIRAKTCVSQQYTRKNVLLTILGDLIGKNAKLDKEAENALAEMLHKKLFPTRYLILIDDIWHTSAWDDLSSCFPNNNNGSRIILTTRRCDVASYAKQVSDPLVLRLLSNDASWMLLQNKVFNEESCPLALEDVGKAIAQKCGGLPLSIILVAGILSKMDKEEHCWEQVMTNLGPHIQAQSEDTINLSYQNLTDHLRPCFLYFGLFSEDKEIQVSKLTWLWISEGFVSTHTEKPLEDIAKDYLENLIGRNLVMVAKTSCDGKIKACRIHDLLFEFCRKRAILDNFFKRIKGDRGVDPYHVFPPPRRLSLHSRCDNLKKWCLSFSHVKSFQFREARNIAFSSIDHASDTLKRFKFLRVLDFEFTMIDSFPQELTLLRYLSFRTAEDILSLPANLWNLETLIVQGVRGRVSLPNTIWKMVKLRHLHIYDQAFFTFNKGEGFSESSSTMDDLQTISSVCFSCVVNADKILEKTPNLQKLRCEVSKFDGSFPAFSNLTKLEMLKISSGTRLTLINQLKFPSKLKKLTLSNFHVSLTEVATLPELEVLKLVGVTLSSNIWEVNDEQFLQLKILKLENPSFPEWRASEFSFPCLEHLVLKRCRYLKVIPSRFEDTSALKSVELISSNDELVGSAMAVRETLAGILGNSGFKIIIRK